MTAPRPGKLTGIEAGRGIAAVAVVLYHAARHIDKNHATPALLSLFQFGHAGVDLFFVISGFIILFVHLDDIGRPPRLGHYISRRFTRIMPVYWIALAVTVGLSVANGHPFPSLPNLAWSASLLPSHAEPLLGIAWTLQYEVVFYAVFCILILSRVAGMAILLAWLAAIVAAGIGPAPSAIPHSLFALYNLEFLAGMLAAYWLRNHHLPAPRATLTAGTALFAIAAVAENAGLLNGYGDLARLAYGLPSALIVIGTAEASRQGLLAVPGFLRGLGAASYSIYLFQFVFIGIAWKLSLATGLDRLLPPAVIFVLLAASGVAGGVLISRTVEYPLIQLARGRRRKLRVGTATG